MNNIHSLVSSSSTSCQKSIPTQGYMTGVIREPSLRDSLEYQSVAIYILKH